MRAGNGVGRDILNLTSDSSHGSFTIRFEFQKLRRTTNTELLSKLSAKELSCKQQDPLSLFSLAFGIGLFRQAWIFENEIDGLD